MKRKPTLSQFEHFCSGFPAVFLAEITACSSFLPQSEQNRTEQSRARGQAVMWWWCFHPARLLSSCWLRLNTFTLKRRTVRHQITICLQNRQTNQKEKRKKKDCAHEPSLGLKATDLSASRDAVLSSFPCCLLLISLKPELCGQQLPPLPSL